MDTLQQVQQLRDRIKELEAESESLKNCCNCGNHYITDWEGIECRLTKHKYHCEPHIKPTFKCMDWTKRERFPEQMPEDLSVRTECTGTDRDSVLNAIFRAYERYKQTKLSYKLLEVEQIQLLGCSRLIIKYNTMAIGFLDENQLTGKTIFHKVGW